MKQLLDIIKKKIPLSIALVLIFTLIKGTLWMLIIPPGQIPDEPAHFVYVQQLAENGRLPIRDSILKPVESSYSNEFTLFMDELKINEVINKKSYFFISQGSIDRILNSNFEKNDRLVQGNNYISSYPPAYYFLASIFYKFFYASSILTRFYAVRFLSVLLNVGLVFIAYLIGKETIPTSKTFAVTLAYVVALQPMASMLFVSVNNDTLTMVISALLIYFLLRLIRDINNKFLMNTTILGLLIGIGLLTKAQLLYVGLFSALISVIFIYQRKERYLYKSLAGLCVPPILIYGWWAYFSLENYKSLFGVVGFGPIGESKNGTIQQYVHTIFPNITDGLSRMYLIWVKWYWAMFGWLNIGFKSEFIYKFLLILMIVCFTIVFYGIVIWFRNKKTIVDINMIAIILFVVFILGNISFLYVVEYSYFKSSLETLLQGRYLFTSLIPISVCLTVFYRFITPNKYHSKIDICLCVVAFSLNVASLLVIIKSYYGVTV